MAGVWPKFGRSSIEGDEGLNAKEEGACAAILGRGEASFAGIAAGLGVGTRTARRILAGLAEKGAVIVRGATNKRAYALNDAYFSAEHDNETPE